MIKSFTISLLLVMISVVNTQGQITISAARALPVGTPVQVAGTSLNGPELGAIRYIQDATGAIAAYHATQFASVNRGDSILVSGTNKLFNNLLELDPSSLNSVLATGRPLPAPLVYSGANMVDAFTEANEGKLIVFEGITSMTTTAGAPITTFAGNTNYRINGDTNLIARVNSASTGTAGIIGKPSPGGTFKVMGVMSQFCSNPASGCTTGYQLLLRNYDDFILGEGPNITTALTQADISSSSFTVSFKTQNMGTTKLVFGTDPLNLTGTVQDLTADTNHTIGVGGLLPATLYYVKAMSTNVNATSESPVVPMMTASLSSGTIKTYFVQPVNTNYAFPGNEAKYLNKLNDDTLIAYINRSMETLDIAIYNWNNNGLSNISAAVNAAFNRGVKVRVIADGGSANIGLNSLTFGINVQRSPQNESPAGSFFGLMHNKFVVIDANSTDPNRPIVWTGSTNWTDDMMNDDPNNVVIFQDQSLAKAYVMEFEEMWGSNTLVPGSVYTIANPAGTAKFGNTKVANTPREFRIGGKRVTLHFSPSDGTNLAILNTIQSVNQSFYVANYVLTRNDLAYAIRDKYTALSGSNCSTVILDDTGSSGGIPFMIMQPALGNHLILKNNSTIFHHKYLIADPENGDSDPTVLTGSHNWSNAGDQRNDENTVIIHDLNIANQFHQEFAARMIQYSGPVPCNFTAVNPSLSTDRWVWWHDENSEKLILKSSAATSVTGVQVVDMAGRVMNVIGKTESDGNIEMDTRGLNKGVYLVRLQTSNGTYTAKWIK